MHDQQALKFIDHVKSECKKYGIKAQLKKTKYLVLSGNIKCSGYFDDENKVLACSMNRPDAIEILAHEYSHLTQYVDQIPLWSATTTSMPELDRWLAGEEVKDIDQHLANCRDLELDNEKRTVEVIKKFNLDIDLDNYVRKSNAYVAFYNYLKHSRKWCTPKRSPYSNPRLLAAMPTEFNMDHTILPEHIKQIFIEERI